jgi:putative cell wall-binding protein
MKQESITLKSVSNKVTNIQHEIAMLKLDHIDHRQTLDQVMKQFREFRNEFNEVKEIIVKTWEFIEREYLVTVKTVNGHDVRISKLEQTCGDGQYSEVF